MTLTNEDLLAMFHTSSFLQISSYLKSLAPLYAQKRRSFHILAGTDVFNYSQKSIFMQCGFPDPIKSLSIPFLKVCIILMGSNTFQLDPSRSAVPNRQSGKQSEYVKIKMY